MRRLPLSLFLPLLSSCYLYSNEIKLCDEIPEKGCPTGRGGTCDDPACEALYDCVGGVWEKAKICNGNAAGGGSGGTSGSGGSGGAGGDCTPIEFDHTGEKTGCTPDLELPDCPAVAAEQCPESACLTGCTDFFICKKAGWTAVAYCDEKGAVIAAKR
jgi:hypothetical protein